MAKGVMFRLPFVNMDEPATDERVLVAISNIRGKCPDDVMVLLEFLSNEYSRQNEFTNQFDEEHLMRQGQGAATVIKALIALFVDAQEWLYNIRKNRGSHS